MSRGSDKANGYVQTLYEARCAGNWRQVQETVRKVEKHAPDRKLLALSSRVGVQIYDAPSATNYRVANQDYGSQLNDLLPRALEQQGEDVVDGLVCRAALFLGTAQYASAVARLPADLHTHAVPASGGGRDGWNTVCVVQGTLIRGIALEQSRDIASASNTYRSIIPYLTHISKLPVPCPELSRWTEELLCQMCLFFSADGRNSDHDGSQLDEAMAAFHLLSRYLDSRAWRPLSSKPTFARYRARTVWRSYYEALSRIIRDDLVYHPFPHHQEGEALGYDDEEEYFVAARIQLRADLRRVEASYEALLLAETEFPRANESNEEVQAWVELVMDNWRTLCGSSWTDEELGSGGKLVAGRTALEILYRAATKTFHSTQVMRYLFTVHSYLGEFDLALNAFDTYVEIMTRGKARAEKSNEPKTLDIDDDATAVRLASEAIRISCRFGCPDQAEKTLRIGERLEHWIERGTPRTGDKHLRDDSRPDGEIVQAPPPELLSSEVLIVAYSAIGMSQANYARYAYSPAQRSEYHGKALENLRLAAGSEHNRSTRVETLYAQGLLLAEMRDIAQATDVVRAALNSVGGAEGLANPDGVVSEPLEANPQTSVRDRFARRKKLIPVWHLLAQLLCASENYAMALSCCDIALEQLTTTADLLNGDSSRRHARNKESISSTLGPRIAPLDLAAEQMSAFEKHAVVEMKMTQLSLIEVLEGPEAAVNSCSQLFNLFTRLFGPLTSDRLKLTVLSSPPPPPKSAAGTVRSVFGRNKAGGGAASFRPTLTSMATSRPATSATNAPTIQVTDTNGSTASARPSVESRHHIPSRKKVSGSLRRKASLTNRPATVHGTANTTANSTAYTTAYTSAQSTARPSLDTQRPRATTGPDGTFEKHSSMAPTKAFNEAAHNLPPNEAPAPAGEYDPPPVMDSRLPVPAPNAQISSPVPHLQKLQEYRHKYGLLVRPWLFAARLYSHSGVFDDANGAIDEANKLVAEIEATVAQDHAGVRLFQERGWGGWKSIEELWADVSSERGHLLASSGQPHDALVHLNRALQHDADHAEATVALADILLDIHAQLIPAEKPDADSLTRLIPASRAAAAQAPPPPTSGLAGRRPPSDSRTLNRLAARDRAYALLSSLTKLGAGWDDARAWFALARAHEDGGQAGKARDALWWCVRLEDSNPVRHWRHVNPGGYVL